LQYPDLKHFKSASELINSHSVDAVLIATPHYDHTTIGAEALDAGLHVLLEKPISVHKADCERVIAAYERNKPRVFAAMFQMRTVPAFKKIRQLIKAGELGEIRRTNWVVTAWYRTEAYYASGGWRATWKGEGGGVLLNQCPHNLDLFQWMCGMPVRVRAFCGFGKYHDIETEDDVTAYLEYANGATGVFIASTGEAPGTDRLEIAGDRGKLVYEDGKLSFTRNEESADAFSKTCADGFTRPPVWNIQIPVPEERSGHAVITQNFVDAILKGEALVAPASEGVFSVELANAMLYSAWTGDRVDLPLDGAAYESHLKKRIAESSFVKKTSGTTPVDISNSFR
jgi:predicted dehydrogenase